MQAVPPDAERSWVFSTAGADDGEDAGTSSLGGNFAIKFGTPDAAHEFQVCVCVCCVCVLCVRVVCVCVEQRGRHVLRASRRESRRRRRRRSCSERSYSLS